LQIINKTPSTVIASYLFSFQSSHPVGVETELAVTLSVSSLGNKDSLPAPPLPRLSLLDPCMSPRCPTGKHKSKFQTSHHCHEHELAREPIPNCRLVVDHWPSMQGPLVQSPGLQKKKRKEKE
jgi:hypothetical protein